MYDNIGGKIKLLAKASFIVAGIASVIAGIAFIDRYGLMILILGPIVSWISSLSLYGFGEIIDILGDIRANTRGEEKKAKEDALRKAVSSVYDGSRKKCPHCGGIVTSSTCEMCGKSNNLYN